MRFITSVLFAAALLAAAPAYALKVTNLDKVTHTVQINNGGVAEDVVIAPGATRYINGYALDFHLKDAGPATEQKWFGLRRANQEFRTRYNDEYVIWPGGRLSIQKYGNTIRGNN